MKKIIILLFVITISFAVQAQATYKIDVTNVKTDVLRGHLALGGRNIKGDTIGVNSFYL